jgi:RimJ/RimL family protein N-acetyltransferase
MATDQMPTLLTERLMLRPFALEDAPAVRALAGDRAIASTTLNIPHPYGEDDARTWIATHARRFAADQEVVLAVTLRDSGEPIGAIGLVIARRHDRAELGYWVGRKHWGRGYASEAARALLDYGFRELRLNRIEAMHFARNPASGRVMRKIGMQREGTCRQHVKKWGRYEDTEQYAILRRDWEAAENGPGH